MEAPPGPSNLDQKIIFNNLKAKGTDFYTTSTLKGSSLLWQTLHRIVSQPCPKEKGEKISDTWHVACDIWHMTHDTWHVTGWGKPFLKMSASLLVRFGSDGVLKKMSTKDDKGVYTFASTHCRVSNVLKNRVFSSPWKLNSCANFHGIICLGNYSEFI